jgi:aryl-alcohol dehydrogenase-like predicted oxidoreductase
VQVILNAFRLEPLRQLLPACDAAGVGVIAGVQAARDLQETAVPEGWTLAELALRWCADVPSVYTVIPGARTSVQARANAAVGSRPPLPKAVSEQVQAVCDEKVAKYVDDRW